VPGVYADSVAVIVETGLAKLIKIEGSEFVDGLSFHPTPGHSIDHAAILLRSAGREALFGGDVLHHPCQTGVSIPLVRAIEVLVASNDYASDLCGKHLTEKEIAWMLHFFENHNVFNECLQGNGDDEDEYNYSSGQSEQRIRLPEQKSAGL